MIAVLIGATMNLEDLDTYAGMLAGNNITRIFPATTTVGGTQLKVLPPWTDRRFTYCRDVGAIPFVSTKVDGDPAGLAYVREQLASLPDWIRTLYITDRHEPEGDLSAAQFQANFTAFLAMVDSLPAPVRSRIRCGPVLTRTWTERRSGNWDYSTYDPGTGDFFGVDMYVQSGTSTSVVTPDTLPAPAEFLKTVRAYRKTPDDTRPRIFPELGVIGMPDDPDGSVRAAWIRGIHAETSTWGPATTGWEFLGWIWWNATGKATGVVSRIGQRRDFPLHLRTVPGAKPTAEQLPGSPPPPVAAYNAVFTAENTRPAPHPQVGLGIGWDAVAVTQARRGELVWLNLALIRSGDPLPDTETTVLITLFSVFRPAHDFGCLAYCGGQVVPCVVDAEAGTITAPTHLVRVPAGERLVLHPVTYPIGPPPADN